MSDSVTSLVLQLFHSPGKISVSPPAEGIGLKLSSAQGDSKGSNVQAVHNTCTTHACCFEFHVLGLSLSRNCNAVRRTHVTIDICGVCQHGLAMAVKYKAFQRLRPRPSDQICPVPITSHNKATQTAHIQPTKHTSNPRLPQPFHPIYSTAQTAQLTCATLVTWPHPCCRAQQHGPEHSGLQGN